jgi:tetratricopeptide (TPR) repeat protein
MGKKHIRQALASEPDSKVYQQFWKNIQKADKLKEQAAELFKGDEEQVMEALAIYEQCLNFDALNQPFNMTILFNKACALNKVHKNEDAMKVLDQAIAIDKEYAKAYIKKGDILLQMEQFEASI